MEKDKLNHRERIEQTLSGVRPDRVPVALWRHFPVDDQDPDRLTRAVLFFQKTYDFDLVKVTPASSFCIKDWGVEDEWRGNSEGTREYTKRIIFKPDDWLNLKILDPHKGHLEAQVQALKAIKDNLGDEVPVLQTIFNPLSQAKNLAGGDLLLNHLRNHPDQLKIGLHTIAESTLRFIEACNKTHADGFFYAIQHAQRSLLSENEYSDFGVPFDRELIDAIQGKWINMLHLHGHDVMFRLFVNYPVQVINWHDRETEPNLANALDLFSGVLCGGLSQIKSVALAEPEQIVREARDAFEQTDQSRFILGTGCVAPIITPHGNLVACRQSVM